MFWRVSDRFVTARKSIKNWPNMGHLRTSSLYEVASEFFATNAPVLDPKLMFWGRFGPFHYCMKVDAKLAELAPLTYKFAKQCCIGTFRNQGTQSTPLDPKLMFWRVSDAFDTAQKSMQNWPNRRHQRPSSLNAVVSQFFP
jgi:hypothetical protein